MPDIHPAQRLCAVLVTLLVCACSQQPSPGTAAAGQSGAAGTAGAQPELATETETPAPVSWAQVQALDQPPAGEIVRYGVGDDQFGELMMPDEAAAPLPVVVLIHGGCWLQDFNVQYIRPLAAAITAQGYATWNVEYRRVSGGTPGQGGYPETFLDIADAIDQLRPLSKDHPLDLQRITAVGHSAGGHLALWAATRSTLSKESRLFRQRPLALNKVVGLAAIGDLADYRVGPAGSCHSAVDTLMGGGPDAVPSHYADGSPVQRLPLGAPAILIQGLADRIVSVAHARAIAGMSDTVDLVSLSGVGHFGLVMPNGPAWEPLLSGLAK